MIYSKSLRIPSDRIGVLIGRRGQSKRDIEEACGVSITVDSDTGEVLIESATDDITLLRPFTAADIVTAIGRGFSAKNAMMLLSEENRLHVINLRQFAGKSRAALMRIRSRIIGEGGRVRLNIERLGNTKISVYGKTVSVIGKQRDLRAVVAAIDSILSGGMQAVAYGRLEAANRRRKAERMNIWEGQNVRE